MSPGEALARLRLTRTDGIGPNGFQRLIARHGTAEAAIDALPRLAARSGRTLTPPSLDLVEREMVALARLGGRFLFLGDTGYPPLLAQLPDPPPALAVLGAADVLARRQVGVVGARAASANGRQIAEDLAASLTTAGIAVTSGFARGIDTAAHQGALNAHGRTIAVFAGGLDVPYPAENTTLLARILAEGGAVIAEAPLGTAPQARHFPRRNRIVAGLVLGLVVIEAALRSGSLITARLALEASREIFAVPGSPRDPRSAGSNDLIRQGAHITETAEDVLAHLPLAPREMPLFQLRHQPDISENTQSAVEFPLDDQGKVLEMIGTTPVAVDDLARRCQLSTPTVQAILLDLEMSGLVESLPGNRVARSAG